MNKKILIKLIGSIIILYCSNSIYSSGIMLPIPSANSLSTAGANTLEEGDPSGIATNPAIMTSLPGFQLSQTLIWINPYIKYENAKSTFFGNNKPIKGSNKKDNVIKSVFAGSFANTKQINDKLYVGLAVYPAIGAAVDYPMDSVLRHNLNATKLLGINIQPTIAFKINDNHSIGLGIIAQYVRGNIRKFADFGGGINHELQTKIPFLGKTEIIPRNLADGYVKISAKSISYGFNLGWIWRINDNFRLGLNYTSPISQNLKGIAQWDFYGNAFDFPLLGNRFRSGIRENGYVEKESINAKIKIPGYIMLSAFWKATPKLNLMGAISYTMHSSIDSLIVNFENSKIVPNGITGDFNGHSDKAIFSLKWKNTFKYALGATYQLNDKIQLRGGINIDKSPTKGIPEKALAVLPDNNRMLMSAGIKYSYDKDTDIIFTYAYEHVKKMKLDHKDWCGSSQNTGPNGVSCVTSHTRATADFNKSYGNVIGLQIMKRF